jgi:hypothetical protein
MIDRKIKIKMSTLYDDWPFSQQTPGESLCWGNYQFYINDVDIKECDFWVVYEGLKFKEEAEVPISNLLLITTEPPNFKKYSKKYLNQFTTVRCAHDYISHKNIISSHPALPWHIGRRVHGDTNLSFNKSYDKLVNYTPTKKTGLLSTLTSDKAFTKEHVQRLEFVKGLKEKFKNDIEVYGRGIRDIEDKWDAIAPYKYHVVIENGCFRDYWTEKISDAFLANAFPFYVGCPNLKDFFPESSFMELDINDLNGAYEKIKFAIDNDYYEHSISSRAIARDLCLNKYNLFPEIVEWCKSKKIDTKSHITIEPEVTFTNIYKNPLVAKSFISRIFLKFIKHIFL